MANRLCPLCGAEYVEWATECADCDVALVDPDDDTDPRRLPEDEQVIYELGGWTLDQRTAVAQAMAEARVPHAWDGDELIVPVAHEPAVDRLLEPIEFAEASTELTLGAGERDGDADDGYLDDLDGSDIDTGAEHGGAVGGTGAAARGLALEPGGKETEYDLAGWTPELRAVVTDRLVEAGVPHRWEAQLLLVPTTEEDVVDDIFDDIEAGGDDAALGDDGAETPFSVLEALFLAADRLSDDPASVDGLRDLRTALGGADERRPPYGMEALVWRRIVGLADELAGAVAGDEDEERDEDAAREVAGELRTMLRPFV